MRQLLINEIACIGLFGGMLVLAFLGLRFGRKRAQMPDASSEISTTIMGAIFALLGLLLAFTFSTAHARLDARRQLIVQEANAIGTAYLRIDLADPAAQPTLRATFRDYTLLRAAMYERLTNPAAANQLLMRAGQLQKQIWSQAVMATQEAQYHAARMLLLPALNEMIDIVTTRTVSMQTHSPALIWVVLFLIAFVCAGVTGYRTGVAGYQSSFYHVLLAGVITVVVYLILDIEYPRYGLIRLDHVNHVLTELAKTM